MTAQDTENQTGGAEPTEETVTETPNDADAGTQTGDSIADVAATDTITGASDAAADGGNEPATTGASDSEFGVTAPVTFDVSDAIAKQNALAALNSELIEE